MRVFDFERTIGRIRTGGVAWALALSLVFGAVGPVRAADPRPGEAQPFQLAQLMSKERERQIGAREHPKVLKAYGGAYQSNTVGAFVAEVGGRLVKNSDTAGDPFYITVLDSPVVNAFALPGGYVYVTRGLMALANSEEELAGVLAHEIGHVTARHAAERVSQAQTVGILGTLGTIGALILGGEAAGQLAQNIFGAGGQLYLLSYSRDQEYEADEIGIRYLYRTGYDPYAMASFLSGMDLQNALSAKIAGQNYDPNRVDYLSTHPNTRDRVERAVQQARSTGVPPGTLPRRKTSYLDVLDGMIYGDSPSQGFVRGRTFSHPELRFTFTVPDGYRIQNSASAVAIAGPSGTAVRFDLDEAEGTGGMSRYLTNRWAPALKVRLANVENITVNGMPAATGTSRVTYQNRASTLRLVAIDFGGGRIYRFLMLTPRNLTERLDPGLRELTYSFRRISAAEAGQLKPLRLRVRTVKSGQTVASFAAQMATSDFQEERFRALNGLGPQDVLRAGQQVKIVGE
jgi:predicted Zn-dependent protease